nr:MAG TPA: head to tail connecting protein [Caudoviricetes sp.]
MKKTAKQIIRDCDKAYQKKGKWDNLYREVFEYMMPSRDFEKSPGDDVHNQIYSSIGEQSADRFVDRVQNILTPVTVDWIKFEAGYMIKQQNDGNVTEINKELDKLANICNVFKNTSNFDVAMTEFYYDLIAGTACLLLLEGTYENPLRFIAVPIKELAIAEGIFGEVGEVYRKFKMKPELIKRQWTQAKFEYENNYERDDKERELVESTYYDYDKKMWIYTVILKEGEKVIVEREYKSNPFIILRWTKCSGEVYGRGLGLKSIKDVKTLNLIIEYSLRAMAFTIPVFIAQQDASFDPDDFVLKPGALNMVPSTASNNPSVTQLPVNVTHDIQAYQTERMEMNIKRNMMDSTIPNDPSRDITATEIAERANELKAILSNSFGRIMTELMYPLIRRIVEVLQYFGYVPEENIDVRDFNGFGYTIVVNTQLANQQSQTEVQNTINALQLLFSLDPQGQYAMKCVDMNKAVPFILEKMGVPKNLINTPETITALQEQEAQNIADAQDAAAERDIAVSNAIEKGKADAKVQAGR